ncbi:MAG: helix-turn-helix domain-containing protein [Bdellovibrionota bacterium]
MSNLRLTENSNEGWIRRTRLNLGMTLNKLGNACGVSISTIAQLEKREPAGHISVETLRRAAGAMNCDFIYSFVPKTDMHEFIHQQAYAKAKRILLSADLHMSLEDQRVDSDTEARIQRLKKKLINEGKVW